MLKTSKQVMSKLTGVGKAAGKLVSDQLRACARDKSGAMGVEYALFASGLGVTVTGALTSLGIDVGALFRALDTPLCQYLAHREMCGF